jgi:hypothetical protein
MKVRIEMPRTLEHNESLAAMGGTRLSDGSYLIGAKVLRLVTPHTLEHAESLAACGAIRLSDGSYAILDRS